MAHAAEADSEQRPNFVIVMTDDQSPMPWPQEGDRSARPFGYCGAKDVFTPQIDRLAADGVVFNRAYVSSSVCSPSRYSLLTGRYAGRCSGPLFMNLHPPGTLTRVENNTEVEVDRPNVASLLAAAGYETGFVGKCHVMDHHLLGRPANWDAVGLQRYSFAANPRDPSVNDRMRANAEWWAARPLRYGFTWSGAVYAGNLRELFNDALNVHNVDWTTEAALEFVDEAKDSPFFLYYATTLPHGPAPWIRRDGAYLHGVDAAPGMTGEGYRGDLEADSAQRRRAAKEAVAERGLSPGVAWLSWFDASIGRLRERLEANGQWENTVFIVTSDHGSWRHGKTTLYEGGVRVPLVVHWPAGAKRGHRYDGLVQNIDLAPTMLELAGAAPPKDDPIDGVSLAAPIQGADAPVRDSLFFELGYARGVATQRWKYIAVRYDAKTEARIAAGETFPGFKGEANTKPYNTRNGHLGYHASLHNPRYYDRDQLYDLDSDPREEHNVYDDQTEKAAAMSDTLRSYLARFNERPFGEYTQPTGTVGLTPPH